MIGAGNFREDLFYRLAEIVVKVPPLSDRPGDAVLLAKHFLTRLAKEMNPQVKGFAPDALAAIDSWAWPGNVRELENRVKRAVIMADGKLVTAEDLDLTQSAADGADIALNLKAAREQADRRMIRQALARSEGNISNTAKLLGISRPTLYDLLKQYDLHARDLAPGGMVLAFSLSACDGSVEDPSGTRPRCADAGRAAAWRDIAAMHGENRRNLAVMMGEAPSRWRARASGSAPASFLRRPAPRGSVCLGRLEMAQGNLPAAGAAFDQSYRADPANAGLWVDIGRLRYAGGEQAQALEAVDRALAIDPAHAEALRFRGQLARDAQGLATGADLVEAVRWSCTRRTGNCGSISPQR